MRARVPEVSLAASPVLHRFLGRDWRVIVGKTRSVGVEGYALVWSDEALTAIYRNMLVSTRFLVRFDGWAVARVDYEKHELEFIPENASVSPETISHLIDDQVVPRIIAHGANLVLHAGCASMNGEGILVLAPSGSGKSTLVASLGAEGWRMLGDDAVVVQTDSGACVATAVHRSLRLLPDSLASLGVAAQAGSAIAQYTTKRRVELPAGSAPPAARLSALFFLTRGTTVRLREMKPAETCMGLVENSFALDPSDPARAARRMHAAAVVSTSVRAYELTYPRDFSRLPEVRMAILGQLRRESSDV